MAKLRCRHCGGSIDSDARRTQCRECGELFPFQCDVCQRNLRTPFSVFDDERYLTLDEANPQPLCGDHFLRHCPDCSRWFHADENPGFFRCGACAEKAEPLLSSTHWKDDKRDESFDDGGSFEMEPDERKTAERKIAERKIAHAAPMVWRDPNTLVMCGAACACLALVVWFLFAR